MGGASRRAGDSRPPPGSAFLFSQATTTSPTRCFCSGHTSRTVGRHRAERRTDSARRREPDPRSAFPQQLPKPHTHVYTHTHTRAHMYTHRSLILETACERAVPIVGPFRKGAEPWPCSPLAGGPTRAGPGAARGGDSWPLGRVHSPPPGWRCHDFYSGPGHGRALLEVRRRCHFKGATETATVTAAWSVETGLP